MFSKRLLLGIVENRMFLNTSVVVEMFQMKQISRRLRQNVQKCMLYNFCASIQSIKCFPCEINWI